MTRLILKLFIKDYTNISSPAVREKYGVVSGATGILCNILLFCIKFFAGIITGAISVTADAFNNLSDAGSSLVTLIGFKMAGKPADTDHPYGHGRIEYITALAIAVVIFFMGFELIKCSVSKILKPVEIELSVLSAAILVVSVLIKLWMGFFNRSLGKKLNSQPMLATATDSFNDCIATLVVLTCMCVSYYTNIALDGYAGVLVALFVLYSGVGTVKDALEPLLGQAPDPELKEKITQCIMETRGIYGVHDMHLHDYGPGRMIISLHAEISSDINVLEAHDIIDGAEAKIKERFNCDVCIHMDPIFTDDPFVMELRQKVDLILKNIDECVTMHDFRVANSAFGTTVSFDVLVPFGFKYSDEEIIQLVDNRIKEISGDYSTNIQIDKY